ncbi:hypothetical protein ACWA7J_10170 [Leptothrix sp. BB-4]
MKLTRRPKKSNDESIDLLSPAPSERDPHQALPVEPVPVEDRSGLSVEAHDTATGSAGDETVDAASGGLPEGADLAGEGLEESLDEADPYTEPFELLSPMTVGAGLALLRVAVGGGHGSAAAPSPAPSPAPAPAPTAKTTRLTLSLASVAVPAGTDLGVDIHDAQGQRLLHVARFVPDASGQMQVDLGVDYSGAVMVRFSSGDTLARSAMARAEAAAATPGAVFDLRAMATVDPANASRITVNVLSEALVRHVMGDRGGQGGQSSVQLPANAAERMVGAKAAMSLKLGVAVSALDAAPETQVDDHGKTLPVNAVAVVLASLSSYGATTGHDDSQVIDALLQDGREQVTQLLLVGAATDDRRTIESLATANSAVRTALLDGLPAQTVAQLPKTAIANIPAALLVTDTLLRLSTEQAGALGTDQKNAMTPSQRVAVSVALGEVVLNTAPERSAGKALVFDAVLEDSAATSGHDLGLAPLAYAPGRGAAEAGQTLTYAMTAIPDFLTLWKAGDRRVVAGDVLTLDELRGLTYRTVADRHGSDSIRWSVTDSGATTAPHVHQLVDSLAVTVTAVNDAPTRTAGRLNAIRVDEDSAQAMAVSLGLGDIAYGNGGGSDEAGQTLTCVITGIPSFVTLHKADGSAVLAGTSLTIADLKGLAFRTVPDATGSGTITWTVTDSGGSVAPDANQLLEQLTLTVSAVNDAPTLSTISTLGGFTEDTFREITYADLIAAADEADVDSVGLSFRVESITTGTLQKWNGTAWTDATAGTLVGSGDKLQWKGAANANGTLDAFTVKAWDGAAASASAIQVKASVSAVNDAPTLTSVTTLTGFTEDTFHEITHADLIAVADEADVDGVGLSFRIEAVSTGTLQKWNGTAWTDATAGTLVGSGEKLQWKGAANANGELNAFTVKAWDGALASATAVQVKATVLPVNDAPTLTTITTLTGFTEDTFREITYADLIAAADEADVESTSVGFRIELVSTGTLQKWNGTAWADATSGTLVGSSEKLQWKGAANANGELNAFTVTAWDGAAASATAIQVKANVSAVNDAPTLTSVTTLTGFTEDTFREITYADLIAAADEADVDSTAVGFRIEAVSTGTLQKWNGTAWTDATAGALVGSGDKLQWKGAANANGTLDAFTVKAWDGAAASASEVQVRASIATVNDAPTLTTVGMLTGFTEATFREISHAQLAAVADESDVDGDALSFRIESVSSGTLQKWLGGAWLDVTPGATIVSTGDRLQWKGPSGANGSLDAFTLKAFDGALVSDVPVQVRAQVSTLAASNHAPTLSAIRPLTGFTEDAFQEITYAQLRNAADASDLDGDALSFRIESVSSGTLQKWNGASWVDIAAGSTIVSIGDRLQWKGDPDANGTLNAFTVKAWDGTAASATSVQVRAAVATANDAPTLTSVTTLTGFTEDTFREITYADLIAAADEADVDSVGLSFRIEAISTGTLQKWNGTAWTDATAGTLVGSGEKLQWKGAANANGELNAFMVKAWDGAAASASAIQVKANVSAVNDAPTLTSVTTLTGFTEDTFREITHADLIAAADEADIDSASVGFRIEAVSTGTLQKWNGTAWSDAAAGTIVGSGEKLQWKGVPNANGELNAFTVKAWDGAAASASAIQVKANVTAVNDAPTLTSVTTLTGFTEDTFREITYADLIAAGDEADIDSTSVGFRIEAVSTGTLQKWSGTAWTDATAGTLVGSGEKLQWKGAANANGELNAFTVTAWDGALASASAIQVKASVTAVNDAPTLTTITTLTGFTEDTFREITYAELIAAADEADIDSASVGFRIEAVSTGTLQKWNGTAWSDAAAGTIVGSGEKLQWKGALNANGEQNAFTVKAWDGALASASAIQVKASVAAVNDAPTLTSVTTLTGFTEDTFREITYADLIAAADEADVDSTSVGFRIEAVSTGTLQKWNGTAWSDAPTGTIVGSGEKLQWKGAANANGELNAFTVTAWDGALASASAIQVKASVTAVNDAPTLTTVTTLTGFTEDTFREITYADLIAAADEADIDSASVGFRIEAVSTGTLQKFVSGVWSDVVAGTTTVAFGEKLQWKGAANANGELNAFTVKAWDGALASASAIQVKASVTAVNDAPTLTTITTLTGFTEDTFREITHADLIAAADEADIDSTSVGFRIEAVSTGTLQKWSGTAWTDATAGTLVGSGEKLQWKGAANANGELNAFTVTAWDGALASASAIQVKASVTAVNDAPTLTTITTLTGFTEDTFREITYAELIAAADEADSDSASVGFRVEAVSTGTLQKWNGTAWTDATAGTLVGSGEKLQWKGAANANGDTIRAGRGNSRLIGGAGDDVITTGDGNNLVDAGSGNDRVTVGQGDNIVHGGAGNDVLRAGNGVNVLYGEDGNDDIVGGSGDDTVLGGNGSNVLDGGAGINTLSYAGVTVNLTVSLASLTAQSTGWSTDTLQRFQRLIGGSGADLLTGSDVDNTLQGGDGNDTLIGGLGSDIYVGGAGLDTASFTASAAGVTASLAPSGAVVDQATGKAIGTATGEGTDTLWQIENLTGSAFGDDLTGDSFANVLNGRAGRDILAGGAGADTFVIDSAIGLSIVEPYLIDGLRVADASDRSVFYLTVGGGLKASCELKLVDSITMANGPYLPDTRSYAPLVTLSGTSADGTVDGLVTALKADSDYATISSYYSISAGTGSHNGQLVVDFTASRIFMAANLKVAGLGIDLVSDFESGSDHLQLSSSVFTALGATTGGVLDASRLCQAPAAATASTRILYDATSGSVSYDPDGSGSASSAVLFAQLLNKPATLSANDFTVL